MKKEKIYHISPYLCLAVITVFYLLFPIKIHQWESYWYAAGIEGLYPVIKIHQLFELNPHMNLNYDIFHPNHPLLHLLTYSIWKLIPEVRALIITQYFNIFFAILALYFVIKTCEIANKSKTQSFLTLLFLSTTNLYWYYGMSGEVYIAPTACLIISFYLILRLRNNLQLNKDVKLETNLIAIFFSLACSFHLISFPFIFVILTAYILIKREIPHFQLKSAFFSLLVVGVIIASSVYGFLFISLVKIKTISEYLDSILILSSIEGNSLGGFKAIGKLIYFKYDSLLNSLIRTQDLIIYAYKIIFSSILIYSFFKFRKIKTNSIATNLMVIWIFIYSIIFILIIRVPFNDYWLLMITPIIFLAVEAASFNKAFHLAIITLITAQAVFNFKYDIFPKSHASEKDFILFANSKMEDSEAIYFLYDQSDEQFFNEFWTEKYIHRNMNAEIMDIKSLKNILKQSENKKIYHFQIITPYHDKTSNNFQQKFTPDRINNVFIEDALTEFNQYYDIKKEVISKEIKIDFEKKAQYPFGTRAKDVELYSLLILNFRLKL